MLRLVGAGFELVERKHRQATGATKGAVNEGSSILGESGKGPNPVSEALGCLKNRVKVVLVLDLGGATGDDEMVHVSLAQSFSKAIRPCPCLGERSRSASKPLNRALLADAKTNERQGFVDLATPRIKGIRTIQKAVGTQGEFDAPEDGIRCPIPCLPRPQCLEQAITLGHFAGIVYASLGKQGGDLTARQAIGGVTEHVADATQYASR